NDSSALAVCITNAPRGANLKISDGHIVYFHLPSSQKNQRIRLAIFKIEIAKTGQIENACKQIEKSKMPDLKLMTEGGDADWNKTITLSGSFLQIHPDMSLIRCLFLLKTLGDHGCV